ncbi:MAG: hypothetical protein AB7V61_07660 [Methylocystis sp.]
MSESASLNVRLYEPVEGIDRLRRDLREVKESWDNRLILENSPFWELYISGRAEIVFYGDWGVGHNKFDWFVRVPASRTVFHSIRPDRGVYACNASNGDDWHKIVMFVVVAEAGNSPEVEVHVPARLYVCKNKVCKVGECLLYRTITAGGFKVFPFIMEREVRLFPGNPGSPSCSDNGSCDPVIQRFSEVVDCIPDDAAEKLRDWLFGSVGKLKAIRVSQQNMGARPFDPNLIQVSGKWGRMLDKRINVAVGPFDL